MVEGSEVEKEDAVCTYVEGVCAVHGPATKKWRGGKSWGVKKNGLYAWKYARKDCWVCEQRTDRPVGGPEPTFI